MNEVFRIWVFKSTERKEHQSDDCKHFVKQVLRGDFEYYRRSGENIERVTRREADEYAAISGNKVETLLGYPAYMHDMGFRA